jgi:cytochrome P450
VMEELDYRDVTFPAGTIVMISAFDGNRDAEMFSAPEEFDISADRERTKPMTFGAGIHYCLGANVARAELQEALAFLPGAMPGLALDGEPVFDSINGIYGLDRLPIRW